MSADPLPDLHLLDGGPAPFVRRVRAAVRAVERAPSDRRDAARLASFHVIAAACRELAGRAPSPARLLERLAETIEAQAARRESLSADERAVYSRHWARGEPGDLPTARGTLQASRAERDELDAQAEDLRLRIARALGVASEAQAATP